VNDDIREVVRDSAGAIESDAKTEVAHKTGETERSIKTKFYAGDTLAIIGPRRRDGGWKAHWIEYGTGERMTTKKGKLWGGRRYKSGPIAKTGHMPKMPFMSPAFEHNKGQYVSNLSKAVRRST
jgi:HK97 gp10 family phage protein